MTRVKHLPASLVAALAVLVGFGCAVAGLFLLAGLGVTLLVAGAVVAAAGLVADVG